MFQCRACVSRSIRALAAESPKQHPLLAGKPLLLTYPVKPTRRHASQVVPRTQPEQGLVQGKQPVEPEGHDKDIGKITYNGSGIPERQLKLELKYLEDRFKFAEHIHYTLRCGKWDKAIDLCRLASKQQDVVVSWNHCINWAMQQGKIDQALKVYNEMKKRAQFPDTFTYSIVLTGLARSFVSGELIKPANLTKALSVYHSMSSPTSRVKPGIVHTNNVLKVCQKAGDMDALWGIVAKMPEQGAGAPDAFTYSILLDAIGTSAFGKDADGVPLNQLAEQRAKAMHEARAVWRDVIKKWRNGQIQIDEYLVGSMCTVLKMSRQIRDWDDILNLVQQTMNIPRQLAELGSSDRHIEHVANQSDWRQANPVNEEDEDGYSDTPTTNAFMPLTGIVGPTDNQTPLVFVQPTHKILQHLIDASSLLQSPKTAQAYWDSMTDPNGPYAVQPDANTYRALLRLLARSRNSRRAVTVLRQMADAKVQANHTTFRIALSICERDIKNPNVLANARAMIDVMESTMAEPDVPTLAKYLKLVGASNDGNEIMFTIDRLDSIIHNLRGRVNYGSVDTMKPPTQHIAEIEETLDFFRSIIGVMDNVLHRELIPKDQRSQWKGRRDQLAAFVSGVRANNKGKQERWERETGQKMPNFKDINPINPKSPAVSAREFGLRESQRQERAENSKRMQKARLALRNKAIESWMQSWRRRTDPPPEARYVGAWHRRLQTTARRRVRQMRVKPKNVRVSKAARAGNARRYHLMRVVRKRVGVFYMTLNVGRRAAKAYLPFGAIAGDSGSLDAYLPFGGTATESAPHEETPPDTTLREKAWAEFMERRARRYEREVNREDRIVRYRTQTRRQRTVMEIWRRAIQSRDLGLRTKRLSEPTNRLAATVPIKRKRRKLFADSQGTRVVGDPGAVTKRLVLKDQGTTTKRLELQSKHVRYEMPESSPNTDLLSSWMRRRRAMLRARARKGGLNQTRTADGKLTREAMPDIGDDQKKPSPPPEKRRKKQASGGTGSSKPSWGRKGRKNHPEKKHQVAFADSPAELYIS